MATSIQLSTILLKLETTSGVDAAPTAAADAVAIRVTNLSSKIDEEFAPRDVIAGYFAAADQLPALRRGSVSFSVEAQASGTLGTPPAWGKALQACGFSETVSAGARVEYLPASTGLKTATIWAALAGRLDKFIYCVGTVKPSFTNKRVPSLDFEFTGLVASSAASAPLVPTLTAYARSEAVSPTATTALSIGAVTYSAGAISGGSPYPFEGLEFDVVNDVQDLDMVGGESVGVYDRSPKVSILCDFTGAQHAAFVADMHFGTTRALGFVHGSVSGRKVGIYCPAGVVTSVEDRLVGKVFMDKMDMTLRPTAAGNDELRIFCI